MNFFLSSHNHPIKLFPRILRINQTSYRFDLFLKLTLRLQILLNKIVLRSKISKELIHFYSLMIPYPRNVSSDDLFSTFWRSKVSFSFQYLSWKNLNTLGLNLSILLVHSYLDSRPNATNYEMFMAATEFSIWLFPTFYIFFKIKINIIFYSKSGKITESLYF